MTIKPKRPAPKNEGGRPTKYKPEYCNQLIDLASKGYSLTGFAGKIRVHYDTIKEWANVHPEFSAAINIAKGCRVYSLETDASRVRKTGGGPGTAAMIIFGLKNYAPDEYQDKRDAPKPEPEDILALALPQTNQADEPGPQTPIL